MSNEQENLTMKQRIDAFYRQSGGPGNPDIERIIEEHLKYGKDHGIRGKKEDIRDAFTEVFLGDRSTRPLVLGLMKIQQTIRSEWERYLSAQRPDKEELIEELTKEYQKK